MSAIAMVLAERGITVSGSDLKASSAFERLRGYRVKLHLGHDASNVGQVDAVLISSAITPNNPEVREAQSRGILLLDRSAFFPYLLNGKKVIAVGGTHGKTTTTSMVTLALIAANLSPSYIIGGELNETGTSGAHGQGEYFVIEADESDKSFLSLGAYGVLVTNLEADHLENYGSYGALRGAFADFVSDAMGPRIVGTYLGDTIDLQHIEDVKTFGVDSKCDFRLTDLVLSEMASKFNIIGPDGESVDVNLLVPGRHNALNATGAIAMASSLGVPMRVAADALAGFAGVTRRYQLRGELMGSLLVDDYAHLPSEVAAVIEATRSQWPTRRVVVVFQPHRYSRTQLLYGDFARELARADLVILTDVYPAGEVAIPGVSTELIASTLNSEFQEVEVLYHPPRSDLADFVLSIISPGDVILTLGAGDITALSNEILDIARLKDQNRHEPR